VATSGRLKIICSAALAVLPLMTLIGGQALADGAGGGNGASLGGNGANGGPGGGGGTGGTAGPLSTYIPAGPGPTAAQPGSNGNGGVGGAGARSSVVDTSGLGGAGGAAGTALAPTGGNGSDGKNATCTACTGGSGAGGGGGGGDGFNGASLAAVTGAIKGGNGGKGGNAQASNPAFGADGGGGGGGGAGAVLSGSGSTTTPGNVTGGAGGNGGVSLQGGGAGFGGGGGSGLVNTGVGIVNGFKITGGNGGNGGNGAVSGGGRAGGAGGAGIIGSSLSLTNSGTIQGGNGGTTGTNGTGAAAGTTAVGGAGVQGSNLQIINSGAIAGGMSGNGTTRANAISFTGSTNRLELWSGSSITGNVVAFSTADILALGGSTNASFNVSQIGPSAQYRGFGTYQKTGTSTWTLTGTTTAATPWTINQGTLQISSDGNLGAASGALTFNGGTLATTANINSSRATTLNAAGGTFDVSSGTTLNMSGVIVGSGALTKTDIGTLVLSGNNTYSGGTTISAGTLQLGNGGTSGSIVGNVTDNGNLTFNRSDTLTFGGTISGSGAVNQIGTGNTVLTADNTYAGPTTVNAGGLFINGDQTAATGSTTVNSGGTLGGTGTVGGNVTIAGGGTLNPGGATNVAGTLTINGDLQLANNSTLTYNFGQANVVGGPLNDLTVVGGNLTLGGTINVATSAGGSFDPGVYRVISYGGALINNGLNVGIVPSPDYFVQTAIDHQVNLVNTNGLILNFWDGDAGPKNNNTVDGGNGTWHVAGADDNWTEMTGVVNAPYQNGAFAIFSAAPGTVIVDNSQGNVEASGMQFAGDGYVITGDAVTLVGSQSIIRVGDGTSAGAGYTATIASVLTGDSELVKTDLGTLVLSGTNTYTGGTAINGGTLQISSDGNLGNAAGGLTFNGGTLATTADVTTSRATTLNAGGGTFDVASGTMLSMGGAIGGPGALTKTDTGTLVLSGANTYSGDTNVEAGTLAAGAANSFSALSAHYVLNSATLDLGGFDQTVSALNNAGTVHMGSVPGTTLTVNGNYVGSGGTIQINTALGGDASATDRLVVHGSTSGASTLAVTNVGGAGAQTVQGIKVVDVDGASDGAFNLRGDYVFQGQQAVIGGAYAYRLYHNGISSPTDGDWYLRSQLINPDVAPPPVPPKPLYQPGVPIYESYANMLQTFNTLDTLQQRAGNRSWSGAQSDSDNGAIEGSGVWARVKGFHGNYDPTTSTSDSDYDVDLWEVQAGADAVLADNEAGRLIGGLSARYGTISSSVGSVYGNGGINTDGYGLGGTLTWYGATGLYIDNQANVTGYDSDLSSNSVGRLVRGNTGVGYAFSIETGKAIAVAPQWSITPQMQLSYSNVNFDSFTDPFGARVSLDSSESLIGRLGIAANYVDVQWEAAGQLQRTKLYGIANLYYDFLDGSKTDVSGVNFESRNEPFWGGIGLGGSNNWGGDTYSLYGEVSLNTSMNSFGDSYTVLGTGGFRVKW
jgi:fibronectin-binding autotransporter adhesin